MQEIKAEDALLTVNGEKVDDWAEKRVAFVGAPGQLSPIPVRTFGDRITKSEMIKTLRKALETSGHTKERARVLAKEHYKKYLGSGR